ncbi:hypothetical protein RDWZM_000440 [Blomia tropicalis]|uniref:Uncharacterized protein n=1 Tax=Blomia tropicalis TaxID=40697 RepID=A0A9Q0M9U8_BLOTA|nr:hypothetical protein RDWZM_000440 [Blomia tropicalis]
MTRKSKKKSKVISKAGTPKNVESTTTIVESKTDVVEAQANVSQAKLDITEEKTDVAESKINGDIVQVNSDKKIKLKCAFCNGGHLSEDCPKYSINQRPNLLNKFQRCLRCLKYIKRKHETKSCSARCKFCNRGHHASICVKKIPKTKIKVVEEEKLSKNSKIPIIVDPPLPSNMNELMNVPRNIQHPSLLYMILLYAEEDRPNGTYSYSPSITVMGLGTQNRQEMGRAFVNYTSGNGCFVSPSYLEKLGIQKKKLRRPIMIESVFDLNHAVTHFAILTISSLYRPEFKFKHVFYVLDCSFYKLDLPSESICKLANQAGYRLSHQFDPNRANNQVDLFFGRNHIEKLLGFHYMKKFSSPYVYKLDVDTGNHKVNSFLHYTHFGYLLTGNESGGTGTVNDGRNDEDLNRINRSDDNRRRTNRNDIIVVPESSNESEGVANRSCQTNNQARGRGTRRPTRGNNRGRPSRNIGDNGTIAADHNVRYIMSNRIVTQSDDQSNNERPVGRVTIVNGRDILSNRTEPRTGGQSYSVGRITVEPNRNQFSNGGRRNFSRRGRMDRTIDLNNGVSSNLNVEQIILNQNRNQSRPNRRNRRSIAF